MATQAFKAGYKVKIGDGADPEVFAELEEVTGISGLGKTNSSIDVTHMGSGNSKEYIPGRADGSEVTVTCNQILISPVQDSVVAKVDGGEQGNIQIEVTDGTTTKTFSFTAAFLSWNVGPQLDGGNSIEFGFKISGDITVA